MKDSTVYTLLGCASLGMAVSGGIMLYPLSNKLNEEKIAAAQELQEVKSRRQSLDDELRNLPKTLPEYECRGLIYKYSDLEKQYAAAKKTNQILEEDRSDLGFLFGVSGLLGLASILIERKNKEKTSKPQGDQ